MGKGKHFIGDFLPPEELEKFMETFKALKVGFSSDSGRSRREAGCARLWTERVAAEGGLPSLLSAPAGRPRPRLLRVQRVQADGGESGLPDADEDGLEGG